MNRRLVESCMWAALAILVNACASSATPLSAPTTSFVLTRNAFTEGAPIPRKFSCDGENASPQLKWDGAPPNVRSFALIMDEPDAPIGAFTYWVAFDLPAAPAEIPEGAKSIGKGGRNGAGRPGYAGPCPPAGSHRYFSLSTRSMSPRSGWVTACRAVMSKGPCQDTSPLGVAGSAISRRRG